MKTKLTTTALVLAPLFLAGCSTSADTQNPDAADTPFDVPPATAGSEAGEPTKSGPAEDGPARSSRGNLIGKVGDVATISPTSDPELDLVTFAITEITPDFACTASYTEPPLNGHYVGIAMDVATAADPEFTEHLYGSLFVSPHSFKYVTAEGTTANDAVGNAYSCLDETQTLPSDIGPGEQVTGMVVLDVPTTDGTIVFEESTTGQAWEWDILQG